MSGICGIINPDGVPVERRLLDDMTAMMALRGPDAQEVWIDGHVGFGHSLLRTAFELEHEQQPLSLDGRIWITADARIDGQSELKRKLSVHARSVHGDISDAALILHAYHVWGEDCLTHLIGDFAFAIWDAPRKRLFCARDHFGVKPFFYSRIGQALVFSNTLNVVRRHPKVSDTLNDLAIADFLLFHSNQDPATSAFADVQRLQQSHCLSWHAGELSIRRYWTLPASSGVRYRRKGEYVEQFREIFAVAVADRLRTDRVAVEMSGGLDSASVAAIAAEQLTKTSRPFQLHAHTVVYDHLIPDQERRYATMVAEMLGIPVHFHAGDGIKLFEEYQHAALPPEPIQNLTGNMRGGMLREAAAHSRVMLTGWDGDAVLSEPPLPYFRWLLAQRQYGLALTGLTGFVASQRNRIPAKLGGWLRSRSGSGNGVGRAGYPDWLNPQLEQRLRLRERWEQVNAGSHRVSHPVRPYGRTVFSYLASCCGFFEVFDAGSTHQPLEFRHPLLDLRLVEFCLSLPPWPWCVKKEMFRTAMRGMLPDAVLRRPKTPLAGWPHLASLRDPHSRWIDRYAPCEDLAAYVCRDKIAPVCGSMDASKTLMDLQPLSLNFWLQGFRYGQDGTGSPGHGLPTSL